MQVGEAATGHSCHRGGGQLPAVDPVWQLDQSGLCDGRPVAPQHGSRDPGRWVRNSEDPAIASGIGRSLTVTIGAEKPQVLQSAVPDRTVAVVRLKGQRSSRPDWSDAAFRAPLGYVGFNKSPAEQLGACPSLVTVAAYQDLLGG